MRTRARSFVTEVLIPVLAAEGDEGVVAVVSHGILLGVLWGVLVSCFAAGRVSMVGDGAGAGEGGVFRPAWANTGFLEVMIEPVVGMGVDADGGEVAEGDGVMPLLAGYAMQVLNVNSRSHLADLRRARGVGSATFDQRQRRIEHFFGGKK